MQTTRKTIVRKLEQIILLLTCIMVVMVAAVRRDGKLWGVRLTEASAAAGVLATPVTVKDDGSVVVNTSTLGRDIVGYAGPVPLEIRLRDGKVVSVKALENRETPHFFDKAKALLSQWDDKELEEARQQKVDVVSGATYSSRAIIGNVQAGLRFALQNAARSEEGGRADQSLKHIAGIVVVLMAAVIPLFYRNRIFRTVQLALNVAVLGFWCGTFLSWSLLVGYISGGINLWASVIPVVMLVTAFVYPLFGRKQHYCTHLCPFGSIQELAGKANRRKWKMGGKTTHYLGRLRQGLFVVLMLLMLLGVGFEWMDYELFSAFIFSAAEAVVIVMALVFVLLSLFVPRPYCRFVCPTGTLLKLADGVK